MDGREIGENSRGEGREVKRNKSMEGVAGVGMGIGISIIISIGIRYCFVLGAMWYDR